MRPDDPVYDRRVPAAARARHDRGAGRGGRPRCRLWRGRQNPGVANVSTSTTSTSHSSSSATAMAAAAHRAQRRRRRHLARHWRRASRVSRSRPATREALKFSECMRANGEPNFPDPNGQGVIQGSGIDPKSPAFQKAQKACAKDVAAGGRRARPSRPRQRPRRCSSHSACAHTACPDFPDPTFSSGGGIRISITAAWRRRRPRPEFADLPKGPEDLRLAAAGSPGQDGGALSAQAPGPRGRRKRSWLSAVAALASVVGLRQ